jgi:nucleoid-associated protein YgaU
MRTTNYKRSHDQVPRFPTARPQVRLRGVALLLAAIGLVVSVAAQLAAATAGAWRDVLVLGPARAEDLVAGLAGGAALAVAGWLVLALVASAVAALLPRFAPAAVVARTVAPHLLRGGVAAIVSAVVIGGAAPAGAVTDPATVSTTVSAPAWAPGGTGPAPATPAQGSGAGGAEQADQAATRVGNTGRDRNGAAPMAQPGLTAAWQPTGADVAPGWVPTPPRARRVAVSTPEPSVVVQPRRRPATAVDDEVVVRRGDSLWGIAARHLGPGSTAAEIAVEWPRWYAANRDLLGRDPDHLVPGTRLRPPDSVAPGGAGATTATGGAR